MTRAMITLLGAILGFMEGIVFFVIIRFSLDTPLSTILSGELLDYPALLFGGVGAVCGAVLGWAVAAWTKKQPGVRFRDRKPRENRQQTSQGTF